MVFHHILRNKRERINVEDVVSLVGRRIVLILFKPLPPTLTIVNFVFIARFMVMMQTIVSHYTFFVGLNFQGHWLWMMIFQKFLGDHVLKVVGDGNLVRVSIMTSMITPMYMCWNHKVLMKDWIFNMGRPNAKFTYHNPLWQTQFSTLWGGPLLVAYQL